jgi:dienelactone hydrolase
MIKGIVLLILTLNLVAYGNAQYVIIPDTVSIRSGDLTLKALLWRPAGYSLFPTVIFTHGSYPESDPNHDPIKEASVLGPLFASRGYMYMVIFRRGVGLSKGQGVNSADLMEKAFKLGGQEARNSVQLQQLETDQLQDMRAGLSYLRERPDVDIHRLAILGHSFGGSLTMMVAENDSGLKAVVVFSPAGNSWNLSPKLRIRLTRAVQQIKAPIMIIHAQNDYSINPGYELDSVMNQHKRPHILKVYPSFGNSTYQAHNLIFLNPPIWEADVFEFLQEYIRNYGNMNYPGLRFIGDEP